MLETGGPANPQDQHRCDQDVADRVGEADGPLDKASAALVDLLESKRPGGEDQGEEDVEPIQPDAPPLGGTSRGGPERKDAEDRQRHRRQVPRVCRRRERCDAGADFVEAPHRLAESPGRGGCPKERPATAELAIGSARSPYTDPGCKECRRRLADVVHRDNEGVTAELTSDDGHKSDGGERGRG